MEFDNVYSNSGYNSYYEDLAAFDADLQRWDGLWELTTWQSLTPAQQENFYFAAVTELNRYSFIGTTNSIINSTHNMQWPRTGAEYTNGVVIGPTDIPQFIFDYLTTRVFEKTLKNNQALAGLVSSGVGGSNVKKQTLGPLNKEFFSPSEMGGEVASAVDLEELAEDSQSYHFIKPYLLGESSSAVDDPIEDLVGTSLGVTYIQRA